MYRLISSRVRRNLFVTILLSGVLVFLFINLGELLDITGEPQKTDVIVYLGGGGSERMKKALELYILGYSKTGKMIFTGSHILYIGEKKKIGIHKKTYLTEHGVPEHDLVHAKKTRNTMEEVLFVKNYMLQHNLKSVIFVSDPPHSRRIIFLAQSIADYNEAGLSCSVVGSNVSWWDKKHYYRQSKAIAFAVSELIKLPYNYLVYGILKSLLLNIKPII